MLSIDYLTNSHNIYDYNELVLVCIKLEAEIAKLPN